MAIEIRIDILSPPFAKGGNCYVLYHRSKKIATHFTKTIKLQCKAALFCQAFGAWLFMSNIVKYSQAGKWQYVRLPRRYSARAERRGYIEAPQEIFLKGADVYISDDFRQSLWKRARVRLIMAGGSLNPLQRGWGQCHCGWRFVLGTLRLQSNWSVNIERAAARASSDSEN